MVAELMAVMLFQLPLVDVARALLEISEAKVRRKEMDQERTLPCRFSAINPLTYYQLVSPALLYAFEPFQIIIHSQSSCCRSQYFILWALG